MSKKIEKPIVLNPVSEYTNYCRKCGAKNTLYPHFIGRRTVRYCEKCNQISSGVTKAQYQKIKEKKGKLDNIIIK